MSTGETIIVAFTILAFLVRTHYEAYFEGWRRGYNKGIRFLQEHYQNEEEQEE